MSPCPVMKMIGKSGRPAMRLCSSRPLRAGKPTSSTRQLGTDSRGQTRNSADGLIIVDDRHERLCREYAGARGLLGSFGHDAQDAPLWLTSAVIRRYTCAPVFGRRILR